MLGSVAARAMSGFEARWTATSWSCGSVHEVGQLLHVPSHDREAGIAENVR